MADTEDPESSSVPQLLLNAVDASPQRGEMQVESTVESSSGYLRGQVANSSRYNLRHRDVDSETQLRRKQQKMEREKCIEMKRLRKEEKRREDEERVKWALRSRALLDARSKAWKEEQRKLDFGGNKREKETLTWEIINKPPKGSGEWLPYESDDEFGTEFELKHTSWEVEKFTLELARCMVGLESFTGDTKIFSCSGTIVEYVDDTGYVVTSASLVRCPDKDEQVDKPKINVWLASGQKLEGFVSNVDFYYNICVIKVPCTFHLPSKSFSPNTWSFNFYENHTRDVVVLGRSCEPCSLKVASGKLIPRRSKFDCEELLVSSCKISKRGVGGPLMDFDGNVIGMNFYDKKETPFLPSFIVLKCLQHFDIFGKVIRPLHGLRVKTLYEANLSLLEEKVQSGIPERCGVIVVKVQEPSAELSTIKVGDIITHVDGVPFSNAAELGGILLDMCGKLWLDRQKLHPSDDFNQTAAVMSLKFRVRTYGGGKSEVTTQKIDVNKFTPSGLNRWPLPMPIIVRQYANGKLVDEEWYTTGV
ncbi:hypothetical protein SETIT_5G050600v2 [Setaria italica]|uniref:PDZ domain-containing protein n=1 Tax=Setaria italica TaxID=4555 RepID=A0A368R1G7_SETIT|nr:uncharacterized protein LOC101768145 [Setaria italica]XP_022682261.1 uncharacterized protein LOC101768145 [Setaria italica]RCV24002.1 hypothetical protein SETIT_5G050600v2 [Setaria italica]